MTSTGSRALMRVLVLAPQGRDSTLICGVLEAAGIDAGACPTVTELASRVRNGAGAALIAEEALSGGFGELADALAGQPSWSDFPVILLTEGDYPWREGRRLPDRLGDAAILARPLRPEVLVSNIRMALRSRQRQYQLQAHMAAQQQRAAEVLEGIYDGYLSMDWQWHCVYVNQNGAALLGYRPEDLMGANMLEIMPHWSTGTFGERIQTVMRTGRPFSVEEWCPINSLWLEVRCGHSVDGLSFFFSDITPRRKSEEHLHLLINELSHRVKNTLAVIQVIADQTFKTGGEIESSRQVFSGRLRALAETHTLLTNANWECVDLSALVGQSIGHMTNGNKTRVSLAGERVQVSAKAALAIGMTMHELSTNAAKYGALAVDAGVVDVRWRLDDGALVIEWSEEGAACPAPPTHKGFGTRMISQAIEYELGGEVEREYRPGGLHCLLRVPRDSLLAA